MSQEGEGWAWENSGGLDFPERRRKGGEEKQQEKNEEYGQEDFSLSSRRGKSPRIKIYLAHVLKNPADAHSLPCGEMGLQRGSNYYTKLT